MRELVKYVMARSYKPVLEKYLSKTRWYCYGDIVLEIPTGVFHPGFFFSTRYLLRHLQADVVKDKSVLELGAGSGLISIFCAKAGANVTATDISPLAIKYLQQNSRANGAGMQVIQSDLFAAIPKSEFDIIVINPPYYKKNPSSFAEYAWYCGENGEYFQTLFRSLGDYMSGNSRVLMVLCESCDLKMIYAIGLTNSFQLQPLTTESYLLEKHMIFQLQKM
jgi:release factor glutamine methyltransferase